MKTRAATEFQERVYAAARRIPYGRVVSYAALASAINCRSARVVGQALRLCPYDDVPCHRVVASGGLLGGYGGKSSGPDVRRKKRLLAGEGIRFDRGGVIESGFLLRDSPALSRLLAGKAASTPR